MPASQIQGYTTTNIAEVESGTKALRVTLRPEDYGSLGIYSLSGSSAGVAGASGPMSASLAAGKDIFQWRWGDATRLCLIRKVTVSIGCVAAITAQAMALNMYRALSFSASGALGTSLLPVTNANKLRTAGMGTTLLTDVRIANTVALTAGTYTLDTNPVGGVVLGTQNVAGAQLLAPTAIWEAKPGEHPLIFAQNEGFVIQNVIAMPATGTWHFGVTVQHSELATY